MGYPVKITSLRLFGYLWGLFVFLRLSVSGFGFCLDAVWFLPRRCLVFAWTLFGYLSHSDRSVSINLVPPDTLFSFSGYAVFIFRKRCFHFRLTEIECKLARVLSGVSFGVYF